MKESKTTSTLLRTESAANLESGRGKGKSVREEAEREGQASSNIPSSTDAPCLSLTPVSPPMAHGPCRLARFCLVLHPGKAGANRAHFASPCQGIARVDSLIRAGTTREDCRVKHPRPPIAHTVRPAPGTDRGPHTLLFPFSLRPSGSSGQSATASPVASLLPFGHPGPRIRPLPPLRLSFCGAQGPASRSTSTAETPPARDGGAAAAGQVPST